MNYLAAYIPDNNRKRLTFVRKTEDDFIDNHLFIRISENVYDYLSSFDSLGLGIITTSEDKNYISSIDELNVNEESDEVETYSNVISTRIKQLLSGHIGNYLILFLIKYIDLNNELISKGYVITNDNRQQKYIEIINSGDEKLIDILSEYSEVYEKLHSYDHLFKKFKECSENLDCASSKEEMEDILEKFLK